MKPSEIFQKMVERIERNPEEFGGAYVIVPPALGGDPVANLVIRSGDQAATAVHFWAMLQTEVGAMLDRLKEQERQGAAFGRR